MKRNILVIMAISLSLIMLFPSISKAVEPKSTLSGKLNLIQRIVRFIFGSKEGKRYDHNTTKPAPASGASIKITYPIRGFFNVFGMAIFPTGRTIVVGPTVNIRGFARNIDILECYITDRHTNSIVFRQSKSVIPFGTGMFTFTWSNATRGDYQIVVWEGAGAIPSAEDVLDIKVI